MRDFFDLKRYAPRWLILSIDMLITAVSIVFAFLLRFNFDIKNPNFDFIHISIIFVLIVRFLLFIITRSYAGIIRYTSTKDAVRIIVVITISNTFFIIANLISYYFINKFYIIPFSIILIDFFISIFLMTAFRFIVKSLYIEINDLFKSERNIIIIGITQDAITAKRVIMRDLNVKYNVLAFIDPNDFDAKKKLDGITVYNTAQIDMLIEKNQVSDILIADKAIDPQLKKDIVEKGFSNDVKILTVPDVSEWINGELSTKQIRNINIEDLLERLPIKLDEKQIKKDIINKTVLVTGAAGSIGREIVLQLTGYYPKKIIIFDQAESPLYDLELELREKYNFYNFEIVIGDVTNKVRVTKVFETFAPDLVFHAAAYKHVPMMENNPSEAVLTNVLGTKNIADLSQEFNVQKFVMISTDKAVNPTNVMGASKRIAEIYTQTLCYHKKTKFITTRFGNVLGSNGSVIPRFRQQIESGGPVTVTHPDVTRYFMTIPEACQLVLEAGALGAGGEIFIFDMGSSVKIVDLAKKMIKIYGLKLGQDINLKFTGLRPGEKLYEELLNDKENTLPTIHEKIMMAKVREYDPKDIIPKIDKLIVSLGNHDNFEIVAQMKKIVPEFNSKNSVYESLDS